MGEQLKGSEELRDSLPYGVMQEMTKVFGYKSSTWIPRVIAGKENANELVLECATRLANAYDECGFEDMKEEILRDYDTRINETGK
ncbi:hypothetical protein MHM83_11090 [Tenacibaculum sp. Mcav3-52]|uniref:hypothetical protein n=1 Tax=Tenacibaculum sp. Mcav3-52 TaxID=2917762 RepID=UPI001EF2A8F6|nr:hypothetical protein [Tenacibaculum sp. Mcav3-52]MCG7502418.1 hypothetical protein [Tenacibaculum sp. Mcav3-52]